MLLKVFCRSESHYSFSVLAGSFFSFCLHFLFLLKNNLLVLLLYVQYYKMDPYLFEDYEGASHAEFCFEVALI